MTRFQSFAAVCAVVVMAPVSAFAQFPFVPGFGNCPNGQCARPAYGTQTFYGTPTYSIAPGGCANGQCPLPASTTNYQPGTSSNVTQANYTDVPSPYFNAATANSIDLNLSRVPTFSDYTSQSTVPAQANYFNSQPPSTIPGYTPQYNTNNYGVPSVGPRYRDQNCVNGQCNRGQCVNGQCANGQCVNGQCPNCNCPNCGPNCNCVNGQCTNCDANQYRGRHQMGRPVTPYTQDRNVLPVNYNFPAQYRLNTGYNMPAGSQSVAAGVKSL